jgi:hypothetical protein
MARAKTQRQRDSEQRARETRPLQYDFMIRRVSRCRVTVEARSDEEAREKAETGEWINEQDCGTVDFSIVD